MIWPFSKTSKQASEPVHAVYGAVVAQARQPHFYADWGVPDTMTGRFDMISLHLSLVLRRLRSQDERTRTFSQALFDLFFLDMDRSLREMGVGDISVPKKIGKMGELFYGLLANITEALENEDPAALDVVLQRNIFGGETSPHLTAMSAYVRAQVAALDAKSVDDVMKGELSLEQAA